MKKSAAPPDDPKGGNIPLGDLDDVASAHGWLFNQQHRGLIAPKTADAMNTTLKGLVQIYGTIPLKAVQLYIEAVKSKVDLPKHLRRQLYERPALEAGKDATG